MPKLEIQDRKRITKGKRITRKKVTHDKDKQKQTRPTGGKTKE